MLAMPTGPGCDGSKIQSSLKNLSLGERFSDLAVKYEALEQKYSITLLENEEYKQHVADLQHQSEDLKQELLLERAHSHNAKSLQPILENHLSSIQTSLCETDEQIEELSNELREKNSLIQSLQNELKVLEVQNNKYSSALETNSKQREILKQNLQRLQHSEQLLKAENQQLRDEIHNQKLQWMELSKLKLHQRSPGHSRNNSPTPLILPDATPRITFNRSDTLSGGGCGGGMVGDATPRFPDATPRMSVSPMMSPFVSCDSVQILMRKHTLIPNEVDIMDDIEEGHGMMEHADIEELYDELHELRLKMERKEEENAKLTEKLNELEMNIKSVCEQEKDDDHLAPYKFIDDDDDDMTSADGMETDNEFDHYEKDEMEKLFQKCHGEFVSKIKKRQNNQNKKEQDEEAMDDDIHSNLIESYRILWWEFQVRQVTKEQLLRVKGLKQTNDGYQE